MSSFIAGLEFRTLEIGTNFGIKEWEETLQNLLKEAALENKRISFLIKDKQIVNEDMFEHISSFLSKGEIAGLFPTEEKAKIIEEVTTIMQ